MHKEDLRRLIIECINRAGSAQFGSLFNTVATTIQENNLGKYERSKLNKDIDEMLWDLIIERFVTFGSVDGNAEARHPFIILTNRGKQLLEGNDPHFYISDEYVALLEKLAPDVDDITKQYAFEAVRCYRHNLIFSAAVMIGAAAERCILSLLESVASWESDPKKAKTARNLLKSVKLPSIFNLISDTLERAIRDYGMPYSVHEGASSHLISFQEMIRVQRNDAVHPSAGKVSRDSVFLSLQTFPNALSVIYRLANWFSAESVSNSKQLSKP